MLMSQYALSRRIANSFTSIQQQSCRSSRCRSSSDKLKRQWTHDVTQMPCSIHCIAMIVLTSPRGRRFTADCILICNLKASTSVGI